MLWVFSLLPRFPGYEELHRDGLQRDHGATRHPAQHAREPRMVHGLHAVPGGDLAGPPAIAAQLPDHGTITRSALEALTFWIPVPSQVQWRFFHDNVSPPFPHFLWYTSLLRTSNIHIIS